MGKGAEKHVQGTQGSEETEQVAHEDHGEGYLQEGREEKYSQNPEKDSELEARWQQQ